MTKLGHSFGRASGLSRNDCHYMAYRFEEKRGFAPDAGESWVLQSHGELRFTIMMKRGWMTSLWRSLTGQLFVTDTARRVYRIQAGPPGRADYAVHDLPATLMGVWGVDDDFVWAWGSRGGDPVLFRWDGAQWHEEPSPGEVFAIHGVRRDLCVAVGARGMIAHWNGRAWARMESPSRSTLSSVFVESEDELYACGTQRDLLAGSIDGWRKVLTHDGGLGGIAKWKGDVWVGAGGPLGLSKLVDGALVSVKPNILGASIDARRHLLVASPGIIASTDDGASFMGFRVDGFVQASAQEPVSW